MLTLQRWQSLKNELGEAAQQNPEFVQLTRVLKQLAQQRQQQTQSDQNSAPAISQPAAAVPQPAQVPVPPPVSTSTPSQFASPSTPTAPRQAQVQLTPQQMGTLKTQMVAFRSLLKSRTVPPAVQSSLFTNIPLSPSPNSPTTPQQRPPAEEPAVVESSPSPAPERTASTTPVQALPATTYTKLGVEGLVDPYTLLPDRQDPSEKPPFIPSIMPPSLDIASMKSAREKQIADDIFDRIVDLMRDLPADSIKDIDSLTDEQLDKQIELKALTLLNKQKALRGDVAGDIYFFNTVAMHEGNQIHFTRFKQPTLMEADITEQYDNQQHTERTKRENQKKRDYLRNVCSHSRDIHSSMIVRNDRRTKLGKGINSIHLNTEKEEQKRIERTAKQRLQALRANDEEAYIKLLDQTKDTRITHLLRQTNSFLDSLAQAVKDQQRQTKYGKQQEPEIEEDENEDEDKEKIDYYAVAHRVKEVVTKQPSILIGGTLKEYQLKGLQWMISLYNNNLNGILADEMGLGKTIQTLSLITYLIETKRIPGPYLVIVPLSTLTNWTLEFERWAPSVKTLVYKGPPVVRKALQNTVRSGDFQVVLTTFEYIIRDKAVLSKIKWVHMIIDEGHRMKNTQSKLSATLTQFYSTKYRLILTGTPLQNNLPELWALLNFVLPKIFNSVKSFDEWFNTPFANTGGQDKMDLSEEETLLVIRRLHKVLRPFLLRRLKKDVEKDLPDKVETVLKCKMSALQASIYNQVLKYKKMVGGNGAKGLNNKLMQLRKVCNHPFVFEEVENLINPHKSTNDLLWRTAGKFELLDRVIPKFQATGHRILVFFQMTQIMDIMEDFLRLRGVQYLRLDGGTKAEDRTDLLLKFNDPNSPYFMFLLSTRAGGLGLNLQTADTVIIYDSDWNPHQDLQAQDRAHRIGQTKEVRILRLITENSVEEKILAKAHEKLDIDGKVIQAGKFDNKSTSEEQEAFLRSLLEQEEQRATKSEDDEELDDDELNEILARSDQERLLFAEIDRERNKDSDYGKGRQYERLFSEKELPQIYQEKFLQEAVEPEPIVENYGRGARERTVAHYDDGLTEEQWLDAIDDDNDTPEDAIARKRARQEKRKQNHAASSAIVIDSASPAEYGTPSPAPSSGVKRKRGRKPRAEVESAAAAANAASALALTDTVATPLPPRKKGKGRPPKIKETLTPKARAELSEKMRILYDHVTSIVEESGRPRIAIFDELPSKRLYPDYYVLIKNPIACDVIKKRINNNTYQSISEFRADWKQMFANARIYNEEGSIVVEDANELERCFEDKYSEIVPGAAVRALTEPSPALADEPSLEFPLIGDSITATTGSAVTGADDDEDDDVVASKRAKNFHEWNDVRDDDEFTYEEEEE